MKGVLYVGNASNKIFAISAKDGSILWKNDRQPGPGRSCDPADAVVFPTEAGNLIAWDFPADNNNYGLSPLVVNFTPHPS